MTHTYESDITVIGAGPVGLFSVFEAGMLGYSCTVIDSLPEVGGQLSALYPEKPIYDIPGYPEILAKDLAEKLTEQIAPFKPNILLGKPAESVIKKHNNFIITCGQNEITSKCLIVAAGGGMFTHRKPPLNDIEAFEETSVFYAVKDKAKFADKTLVIAGGGDSAADWAVELAPTAKHIHVVHRRPEFRAAEETVRQMQELEKAGKITVHTPCQLSAIHGDNGQISTIGIADLEKNETTVEANYLLCFFGIAPSLGPIAEWGLDLNKKKIDVDPKTMKTNVEGILSIGDIAHYEGKMELILTGFAEAAVAARSAQGIIEPDKKFRVKYSTNTGVPNV
jgi:thioredoxin reductase (NADPH)